MAVEMGPLLRGVPAAIRPAAISAALDGEPDPASLQGELTRLVPTGTVPTPHYYTLGQITVKFI